jgi:hypothetical protein
LNVLTDLIVGSAGKGIFTQRGGVAKVLGNLIINENPATESSYALQGGTLNVSGATVVGDNGLGYFTQSKGKSTHGSFVAGNQFLGEAEVEIGGKRFTAENMVVGNEGIAVVQKTAGRMVITNDLIIGNSVTGAGVIERGIPGGDIEVGGDMIVGNLGYGIYYAEGGKVTVKGDLLIAANPGSTGVYETFAANVTAKSIVIGEGGFFSAMLGNEDRSTGIVRISGDFLNLSGDESAQFTSMAELRITRGSESTLTVVGDDQGAVDAGNEWLTLTLEKNAVLSLQGSLENALYVDWFNVSPTMFLQLDKFVMGNGINIYYNADATVNRYLAEGTYDLGNGGQLIPYHFDFDTETASAAGTLAESSFGSAPLGGPSVVPEPSTGLLVLSSAAVLWCRRSRRMA